MTTVFLPFLVPMLLFAGLVVALIVFAIRRALASNRSEARAAYRAQQAAELEAGRDSLAPLPGPEALVGRGRSRYTGFGTIQVSGELQGEDGRDLARYRLRWGRARRTA